MQVDTNMSGNTHDARKHSSSPWILIHPSCSDWCPLHLVSPADTPGYGSGGRFAAQMARAFSTTCPAFSNRDDAKTRPRPTWHNTSNGKSVFPLHTIRWANGWAFWESEIPPSRPWRGPTGLNRNKRPAVVLSFSAFHNPAPTGSYGTLSRMDWLWNIVLEKQFNRNEIKQNKTNKKGISGQSHLISSFTCYTQTLISLYPLILHVWKRATHWDCNNWGKFQSMLLWFTYCTTCASDQLKSMLPGTWTVLLLPSQCIGQDKSYHWLCRRRPPVVNQAHLSTLW